MFFNRAKTTTAVPSSAATTEIEQAQIAAQASRKRADADLAEQQGQLAESLRLRDQMRALVATL